MREQTPPVALEGLGICGQACSVPAVVTGELASEVGGSLTGQPAQVLGTVCKE
jgi:hypothetical protein